MAAAVAPRTILDAMIACGVDNVELFLRETQAQRLVDDIFDDSFASCWAITFKELDNHFKRILTCPRPRVRFVYALGHARTSRLSYSGLATRFACDVTRVLLHSLWTESVTLSVDIRLM